MRWSIRLLSIFAILTSFTTSLAAAQTDGVLQINSEIHAFLKKQQALGRLPDAHLEHLPLSVWEAQGYLKQLEAADLLRSQLDRTLLDKYLHGTETEAVRAVRRLVPAAYENNIDVFSFRGDGYAVQLNPYVYAEYGRAFHRVDEPADNTVPWRYARGARLSGHIGRYVFFESRLAESRERPIQYVSERDMVPRLGQVTAKDGLYDHFEAEAVVGFRTRHVEARFGRDYARWGSGIGSLILSNYASPYDQLQIRATLGRFQYVTNFAGLSEPRFRPNTNFAVPRKYAAFHRLSIAVSPRLTISVSESIVFSSDTLGIRKGFDITYLNPIIFYRAAERSRGTPDNVLLGGSALWRPLERLETYTQIALDELRVSEIGKGWWANKWGWLLGFYGVPTDELTLRLEYARIRPFMYSHRSAGGDFVHYNDVLGHPAGPNSIDWSLFATYRPAGNVLVELFGSYTLHGRNTELANFGGDPLESNLTRVSDTDVWILQGVRQRTILGELRGGYEVLPDLWIEGSLRYQALDDELDGLDRWVQPFLSMRWGTPFRSLRF